MVSAYDIGTRCWYPDEALGWIGTIVKSNVSDNGKHTIVFESETDSKVTFTVETDNLSEDNEKLPPLRNPPILEAAEDLTSLSYLNEPAVLHAIKLRYSQLNIYTYSGIVLIATNPFQRVDQLYSQDIVQAYAGKRRGELDPHLFAIAEDAYRCMKEDGENQTIVVSGESGAGKTVSAKYIMRYFASVEEESELQHNIGTEHKSDMSDVEKQILATNPIMEAFGNAKTTRNDNSSRFGKYLEILFDKSTSIIGARIRTYLLERSRLVFQPETERNYHIFYQILAGMNDDDKAKLGLSSAEDYKYTNQGGQPVIEGINDAAEFQITRDALSLIGITDNTQFEIYKIMAALLHIGNIDIAATRNDAHLSSDEPNLVKACELLGIDPVNFAKWCIKKQITTRSEKIISNLNHKSAVVARDSFAKYIYAALFDWLVDYVNADLCPPDVQSRIHSFIGVLDIYGFEHFEKNSFEQFCINYANEKLQQEFNQHVFKLEQEEYIKEEIEWSFIDFADNQPCITLIENKLGILSLLDEESRLPAGNDQSWIEKMYSTLDKEPTNKVFKKPRFGQTKFIVSHYALDVTYDIDGFIEKNRDTVGEGHLDVMKNTTNELLQSILAIIDKNAAALELSKSQSGTSTASSRVKTAASKKPTLGTMFKNSLIELMKTIDSTNVHYIRCIKPNEQKKAWEFDSLMVLSQLRACGVLETIRISCAGFPSRWSYVEFADRYHILVPSDEWIKVMSGETTQESVSGLCNSILQRNIEDKNKYQLGNSKIFFKAGMLAHFEKLRADKLHKSAVIIQKNLRARFYRTKYLETRESHIALQALIRGFLKRDQLRREREHDAAVLIQTAVRSHMVRKQVKSTFDSILVLQKSIRGLQARRKFTQMRTEHSTVVIQNAWRGYTARREFKRQKSSVITIQSAFRRKAAVRELQQLKVEAKSVNKLKEVSYKLENKVIDLTQSLTAKIQDNKKLVEEITSLKSLLEQQGAAHETLKTRELEFNQKFDSQNQEHQEEIVALNKELESIKAEYASAEQKIEQLSKEQADLRQDVQRNIEELNKAKADLVRRDTIEVDLKTHIEQLKKELANLQSQQPLQQRGAVVTNGINNPKGRNMSSKRHSSALAWNSPTSLENGGRPVSVIAVSNDEDANIDDINDELFRLLRDSRQLHREIVEGLLKGLKIPPAGVAADLTRKEVLFPARIIIIILSDMWRLGLTKESEEFLGEVLSSIQQIVSTLKDDDVIPNGAFWLSNTHELYSFVSYAQQTIIANDTLSHEMSEEEFDEYLKLVAVVKEDFESLSYNIYNMWMKKMEKDLEKKAVSAVVLSQSLPGFMAPENSPFLAKVFSPGVQYKMDDILSFFNAVYWSMKSYFIEHEVMNEVIIELLRFVDALCFNDLIMRRNFLSWKRGLQLNYNVTRLEEWCKGHEIQEGSAYLSHLLQAAKLLQLRKNTPDDIDIIYEICYALKPIQIQKLISQYYVADYETPIAPNVLQAVADKVKANDSSNSDDLFELVATDGHFNDPFRTINLRPFSRVEAYVPAWLNLPVIRRIVELVAKNASVQESNNHLQETAELDEDDLIQAPLPHGTEVH
ncbi:P-loop containing nucleoside triphosphate hydrolase protein [Scheffersomyces xylosifermentans]|uniref:P-loop containing nucleoside triphosphate hydrolase protein n=1 Tax=Scheffersomyces xylosifermentans TaxID=1304137 RepID=UPI00315C52EA